MSILDLKLYLLALSQSLEAIALDIVRYDVLFFRKLDTYSNSREMNEDVL